MTQDSSIPVVPPPKIFVENRGKAAALFLTAITLLATMDVIVKLASSTLSTPQIVWGRYISQVIAIVLIVPAGFLACARSKVPGMQLTELLPLQAKIADKFSVVRSLHHDTGDHFTGGHWMLTGRGAGVSPFRSWTRAGYESKTFRSPTVPRL